ncbi:MAG: hypothetical protein ABUJ93_08865 [Hyphomicrobium sp.]
MPSCDFKIRAKCIKFHVMNVTLRCAKSFCTLFDWIVSESDIAART